MWQRFQQISINGVRYSKAELQLLADVKLNDTATPAYQKSLFRFISEWLNTENYIVSKTSGSTDLPKTIQIDKNKIVASANITADFFSLNRNTNSLLCLSCEHIAGKMMVARAFVSGMNLIVAEPSSVPLNNLQHHKIDFAAFVPMQMFMMLQDEKCLNRLKDIRHIIIGGSEISYTLRQRLKVFPNKIYETFGMTETVSHIALRLLSGNSEATCFVALKDITVSKNNYDCLVINAPHLSDEPIVTNDIVEVVDEKSFKWLGRSDNVVISGALKFYPESIEQKLQAIIRQRFFVAGLPDEKLGEQLVLIIESKESVDTAFLNQQMSILLTVYEVPKQIFRLNEFIYTANGKLNRKATLKRFGK